MTKVIKLQTEWQIHTRPVHDVRDMEYAYDLFKRTMKPIVEALEGEWDEDGQQAHFEEGFKHPAMRMLTFQGATIGCFQVKENDHNLMLRRFYIEPDMQGKGIGRKVIGMALMQAHHAKKPLDLDVLENNLPAINAYLKTGFNMLAAGDDPYVTIKPQRIHMRHQDTAQYQHVYFGAPAAKKFGI